MPRTHGRRRALVIGSIAALLLTGTLVLFHRDLISYAVTSSALAVAAKCEPGNERALESYQAEITERYGYWFRKGYLDRGLILKSASAEGFDDDTWGPFLVLVAYYDANEELFDDGDNVEEVFREFCRWLDPVVSRPKTRALLVNLLTADWASLNRKEQQAGLPKLLLGKLLFMRGPDLESRMSDPLEWDDDMGSLQQRCAAAVEPEHWAAIVRDLEDPREKVRAGALLLLLHHPNEDYFKEKAVAALDDPSRWVRLAAAGALALEGDRRGAAELLFGLCHPRWEVRWWSGAALAVLDTPAALLPVAVAAELDPDRWVREDLDDLVDDSPSRKELERWAATVEKLWRLEPLRAALPESFLLQLFDISPFRFRFR